LGFLWRSAACPVFADQEGGLCDSTGTSVKAKFVTKTKMKAAKSALLRLLAALEGAIR
jgi:hypothetical protein